MEHMLEAGSAIARDFEADRKGALKHLLRAAVLLDKIKEDFYFTGWPLRALMAVFVALAPVGRLLGYGSGDQDDGGQATAVSRLGSGDLPSGAVLGGAIVTVLLVLAHLVRWCSRARAG